jgi:hypothetical protein
MTRKTTVAIFKGLPRQERLSLLDESDARQFSP